MWNIQECDNNWINYIFPDMPSFLFVCSHKEPIYVPECNEMQMSYSRNVTKCRGI